MSCVEFSPGDPVFNLFITDGIHDPCTQHVYLSIHGSGWADEETFQLHYSADGFDWTLIDNVQLGVFQWDVSAIAPGTYFVRVMKDAHSDIISVIITFTAGLGEFAIVPEPSRPGTRVKFANGAGGVAVLYF